VSTGLGPVTLYQSFGSSGLRVYAGPVRLGGTGPRPATGPSSAALAARGGQLPQATRASEAAALAGRFQAILNAHRLHVTAAIAPVAPAIVPVNEQPILARHETEALRGIGALRRSAKAAARQRAAVAAAAEIEALRQARDDEHARQQRDLDDQWHKLTSNDPGTVLAALTRAFCDTERAAAAVSADTGEASIVILAPDPLSVPERIPERTEAGNLSLKKLTKTRHNAFYTELVSGHVLATVRQALAAAPGLTAVQVAAIRPSEPGASGAVYPLCLLASRFTRQSLASVQWQEARASEILTSASSGLQINLRAYGELRPVDLTDEPELAGLVQSTDLAELGYRAPPAATGRTSITSLPPAPHQWRAQPGWGTIRDYVAVTNDHGGTDIRCTFVPDDATAPISLSLRDSHIPGLGEYARATIDPSQRLTVKVSASAMHSAERGVFRRLNEQPQPQRIEIIRKYSDVCQRYGWTPTPDYKLTKAAPGLLR
jgi:hypothetical protein